MKSKSVLFFLFVCLATTLLQGQDTSYFDKYNNQKLGTIAPNFSLEVYKTNALKDLNSFDADSIYLFFYDPFCEHCHKEIKKLKKDKSLKRVIKEQSLVIITIAPDISKDVWSKTVKKMPRYWCNAYSNDTDMIIKKYLWKVPELFVLDKNKVVRRIEMYRESEQDE